MKLVTKQATKLGAEGGRWLKSLIDASAAKDSSYFKFMGNLQNLLTGDHWKNVRGMSKKEIKMVINLAHAHVRSLAPTLFFQNPSMDCVPTSPQHAGKEQTWNAVINNTLDKIGFDEEFKKYVLDAVLYPEGVMKDIRNKPDAPTSETANDGPAVWLSKGAPAHVRISPAQLIVDYTVKDRDVDKARFICIRYKKQLHELMHNPLYKGKIKLELKNRGETIPTTGNAVGKVIDEIDDWDEPKEKTIGDTQEQTVTIYECWIHQLIQPYGKKPLQLYQQMCVLLEGQDEPIRELATWESVMGEGFNRMPVTRLVLNPVPDLPPSSELGVWQNMQMAINWLMSRITELVENDRLIYAVDISKIKNPVKFRQEFYAGRSRVLAEVTGDGAIELIQPSFVGRDNYTLINLYNQYIQQVAGLGQNRRGGAGIRTATEASIVEQGTQIKTDEKVDSVTKALKKILFKTCMIIRSLVKNDAGVGWVFYVGGEVGAVKWINFTKEDIDWLPEVRIRANSFRKMDSQQEMQKYAGLMQVAMQLFAVYGPTVRVDLLFGRMLEAAGIYDHGKIVGDMDKQAMLQTLEISAMMAGIPAPTVKGYNHPVHIQVIDAFMQSDLGQKIVAMQPELGDVLMAHKQEHIQFMEQIQQEAAQMQLANDPFAAAGSGAGNAQSEANGMTEGDRTAVQSVPGGNGEFA